MALGAFLAGMVVGRSDFSLRAASEALPMRDAFAVLFFVSVGLLLEPAFLLSAPGLVAATLAIILVGKPLAALGIIAAMGYPLRTAFGVALALAQIGEFSFILATEGRDLGIIGPEVTNALVAAAILSISVNPLFYRTADPLAAWLVNSPSVKRWLKRLRRPRPSDDARKEEDQTPSRYRAVVVGFGPVGRTLVRLLRENDVEPTVIDLNFEAIQAARRQGVAAVYGDVTQRDALQATGVAGAGTLILSASNLAGSAEVIRAAKELNPTIRVLARGTYVAELAPLNRAGADVVFSGEGEVALALTVAVLGELGATAEQIDRERERVRRELLETPDGKPAPQR
jgi:CPA2 family monovalent cation:H+ antiporter-2